MFESGYDFLTHATTACVLSSQVHYPLRTVRAMLQASQTPEVDSLTFMEVFIELDPLRSRCLVLTVTGIPWLVACGCIPVSSVFPSLTDCLFRRTVQF